MEEEDPRDHDQIISDTKDLAGACSARHSLPPELELNINFSLHTSEKLNLSVDDHKNLSTIKGSEELIHKLKDIFSDFNEHEEKLRLTINSSNYVYRNLVSLETTMRDVDKFLTELSSARTLFFSKTRTKHRLYNILHALRAKNTQLLTSVTLELLSRAKKPSENSGAIVSAPSSTVEFDIGFAYYHGICRPKNFSLAVEKFKEAAAKEDAEAMLMLSECYSDELGLEKDEHLSSQWIDKAADLGCPGALHRKAMHILRALEFSHPDKVNRVLSYFDAEASQDSGFGEITPVPEAETDPLGNPQPPTRERGASISPSKSRLSFDAKRGNRSQSARNGERHRDRDTEREIERNMRTFDGNTSHDDFMDREEEENVSLQSAVQLLLKAAEMDFVAAKTDLGILFELAADDEKALKWFTLASSGGCPKATNRLGLLYFHGKSATQHLERAFSLFVAAAKAGDRDANNNAGSCLEQGLGTEMRPAAALGYYLKGAEQDSPQAMYSLGYLLIRSSVKSIEDLKVAREMQAVQAHREDWASRGGGGVSTIKDKFSASNGVPRGTLGSHRGPDGSGKSPLDAMGGIASPTAGIAALDCTSSLYDDDGPGGRKERKPLRPFSVQHGSNKSNMFNGISYSNDIDTNGKARGNMRSMNHTAPVNSSKNKSYDLSLVLPTRLNDSYRGPDSAAIDSLEAQQEKAEQQVKDGVRWLRAAAERGVLDARYQLGLVYEQGIGCPSDLPSALSQYEYAAREGHTKAAVAAANLLYDNLRKEPSHSLEHSPRNLHDGVADARYRKVMELYRIAAVSGVADAMNCLGLLLEDGRGCGGQQPDVQEAASWYMEACIGGKRDAAVNLALLLSKGGLGGIRSLDGIYYYSVREAAHWLEEYRASTDMPAGLRSQLDSLLYQLLAGSSYYEDSPIEGRGGSRVSDRDKLGDTRSSIDSRDRGGNGDRGGNRGNIRGQFEDHYRGPGDSYAGNVIVTSSPRGGGYRSQSQSQGRGERDWESDGEGKAQGRRDDSRHGDRDMGRDTGRDRDRIAGRDRDRGSNRDRGREHEQRIMH